MPRVNLRNSIYQQKGSGMGLTVKNGMLINNAPDGQTGIQTAVQVRKSIRRAEKVSTYAEGVFMAERMEGGCDCDK